MADDFDKHVYVLSTLSHVRDHAPHAPVIEGSSEKKHLNLLNDIALALTTKAKGDVTAVTMIQSATAIEFLYSKNAPCNGSLDTYLQSIKKILASNEDLTIIQSEILKAIVSSCIEKFRDRVIKCQKEVESCGNVAPIKEDGTSMNLCDYLREWHGLSSTEIIRKFLKDLQHLDTRKQALKANLLKCLSLSREACIIGTVLILSLINLCEQLPYIIIGLGKHLQQYPTLLRRVQKLGAYHGMALRFKKLLVYPNFFKLRGNISFVEISLLYFFDFGFLILRSLTGPPRSTKNFCCPPESG